mmetsp:Transcript_21973/g.44239  ORF Transcript_21973/g.44239 Transcript_21973/m.44239 type:complete len:267 (+) Transcript_21973:37-837(+)
MLISPSILHKLHGDRPIFPSLHLKCCPKNTPTTPFLSLLRRNDLLLRHGRLDIHNRSLSTAAISPLLHLHSLQFANAGCHIRLSFSCGLQFRAFLVDHVVLTGFTHSVGDGGYGGETKVEGNSRSRIIIPPAIPIRTSHYNRRCRLNNRSAAVDHRLAAACTATGRCTRSRTRRGPTSGASSAPGGDDVGRTKVIQAGAAIHGEGCIDGGEEASEDVGSSDGGGGEGLAGVVAIVVIFHGKGQRRESSSGANSDGVGGRSEGGRGA